MSLADRLATTKQTQSGLPCSIGRLLATLKGDELAALEAMLGTPERRGWSQRDIYITLRAEGYEVGLQTINRHRAGMCRCGNVAR